MRRTEGFVEFSTGQLGMDDDFVILFAILYLLLYRPVKRFMGRRAEHYKKMDEEANAKLAESERAKAEYDEKLSGAEKEIARNREAAHRRLDISLDARKKQAEDEAEKIIADARTTAEHERERMLREARGEIADMAADAAQKIVSDQVTSDAFDQFLEAAKRSESDD